ncbi:MFS transporter [Nibricoccus sp. IMCC34717]|uniref:MFS transporter n=1 Tax=Nibricoccus sp. IMCC34717 TaxID=3034021 RepID=UPI00384A773B
MNIPSSSESQIKAEKRLWRNGTLVYSLGAVVSLFLWLLWGDFAWNMRERAATPVAQLVLRKLEASDFLVGLLVGSVPMALALVVGPWIASRSDRHRGRWGRRIPYLLFPAPFAAISMVALGYSVDIAAFLHANLGPTAPDERVFGLIVFGLLWTIFEFFATITNAIFGGLINDVVPRELLGRFFGLFRIVSLGAGMLFNLKLIGYAETHPKEIFVSLGLLYGVGISLMCLFVKEGDYPPIEARDKTRHPLAEIGNYFRECFANRYYLLVFLSLMVSTLTFGPINNFSLFYAKSLGMDVEAYGRLLVVTYSISLVLAFLIGWAADRFHPLRVAAGALALYAINASFGYLLADNTRVFSICFVAHGVFAGAFYTGVASAGQRLYPKAKFARFDAAAGMLFAVGYMVMPPALGAVLDASGHNYRIAFLAGAILAGLGTLALLATYRAMLKHVGPEGYIAPN